MSISDHIVEHAALGVDPTNAARAAKLEKIMRVVSSAQFNNPVVNALYSGATLSAVSAQPAGNTWISLAGLSASTLASTCNLLGAVYTSDGLSMVPVSSTQPAGGYAYSGVVEVCTYGTTITLGLTDSSLTVMVSVDDGTGEKFVQSTPYTYVGTGGTQYLTISGMAASVVKTVRVYTCSKVRFIGYSGVFKPFAPDTANVVSMVVTGDSYTAGSFGDGASIPVYSWAAHAFKCLGIRSGYAAGIGGTGYTNPGSKWKCYAHIGDVTNVNPDLAVFAHGYNDYTLPQATVVADAVQCWQYVLNACPNTFVIVMGMWSGTTGPSATLLGMENALASAVAGMNDPRIIWVPQATDPSGPWVYGAAGAGSAATFIGADGTHPTTAGALYLGRDRASPGIRKALRTLADRFV